jgi:hypothetical protein
MERQVCNKDLSQNISSRCSELNTEMSLEFCELMKVRTWHYRAKHLVSNMGIKIDFINN